MADGILPKVCTGVAFDEDRCLDVDADRAATLSIAAKIADANGNNGDNDADDENDAELIILA